MGNLGEIKQMESKYRVRFLVELYEISLSDWYYRSIQMCFQIPLFHASCMHVLLLTAFKVKPWQQSDREHMFSQT
jgi:hypothetical protein